jgi:hypothetical protein
VELQKESGREASLAARQPALGVDRIAPQCRLDSGSGLLPIFTGARG